MLTVYTTDSCAFCPMVKAFLSRKNLQFKEVNVSNDNDTRAKLHEATGLMTVPVTTDNNGKYVVGYNPMELAKFAN